ncbi:PepSY-associated TM helix domain-containing protein [Rhizobium sp. SL42]|uniref:PepSY-associated TM helix domain-containing protein n=1 Tax=Rhizobium sp. SL42 TaxID=2806346 RepID=UPI001F3AE550|nr:PepSY domain-containing protein [Rhizobium sp. SL42]UJW75399.1 PepSY domain-containing protein [Rhizobium sp. SL42]
MSTVQGLSPAAEVSQNASRRFYFTAWRWHFYAGLYVAPFLLMLAVTGLVMLWSAVFVGRDGEKYYRVAPQAETVSVSRQAEAAFMTAPDGQIVQYIAPRTADGAAVFRINQGDASSMVAVDPYTAEVLGTWERHNGLYDLANTIHGTLMLGTLGDRLIEIAAGFGVVLVVTGLYLWWPRGNQGAASVLLPNFAARGRALWKSLHLTVGFYISAILLVFLLSGLTWAGIWGEKMTQAWSTFPAAKWDNVPLSDETHASMNHGGVKNVPWTLEQTPLPASGSSAGTTGIPDGQPVDIDAIVTLARTLGFDQRFQLAFPGDSTSVWTISRDTMSNDSANPLSDRTVHIDQYTGKILADVGFADYGTAGKAMAVGIAFHEGDMGLWNLALVTVFCLSIIFLSVSGIVMWWKRRPKGATRLVAPAVSEPGPLWKTGAVVMLAVSLLFPLSGAVLVGVLLLDLLVIRHVKPLKRAVS